MFFICKLNPSSYFLSLLIWTADCTQFLSENHLNGCQICGQFGCFKTESETIFSFLHSCYIPHSAYFVHLRYTMSAFCVLVTTTPEPTPRPRIEYQIATWSLVGASIITLIIIAALGMTLWLRTRDLWQPSRLEASGSLLHGDLWCR